MSSDPADYYQRGLSFLSDKPPNLIKALSLIRKAKFLFDQNGNDRESEAAQDKIFYVYMSIVEKEYNQAQNLLTIASYEKALAKAIDAFSHLEKSHPKYTQKTSRKIQNLIEQIGIELLYDVERNQNSTSINESLSKLHYVERVVLEVFYPQLKPFGDSVELPENFIQEIQDKRKIQRAFINLYESLGNLAKKEGKRYIQEGNITQGASSIDLAKKLYQSANFSQRIKDLEPIYQKIYESQGDLAYTYAETLVEDNRLEKARHQLKKARKLYTLSTNSKKQKAAEDQYLDISVKLGNQYLEDAEKALQLNDLKSTIDYLKLANDFFRKINHKKLTQKTEQKLHSVYTLLGDQELSLSDKIDSNTLVMEHLEKFNSEEYSFQSEFFIISEIISLKLQRLHGASYYYQKARNEIQFKKVERKIQTETEKIANLYLNQGKKDIKYRHYEKAHIHLKKSIFYFQKDTRRISTIKSMIQKFKSKIDPKKLERIKNSLIQYNEIVSEKIAGIKSTPSGKMPGEIKDQQFRCKNCGDWVPAYFYDSIQERCIDCRSKIQCDECRKAIGPNQIYQKCFECNSIFCLDCSERVFDFIQKKCLSCRIIQECDICQREVKPTESFSECANCHKICCDSHYDHKQGLCIECRKVYTCKNCKRELDQEDAFLCDVGNQIFCAEHFDIGRNTCLEHRKEEICAKCGTIIKKEEPANKCKNCEFMYCTNHFSEFHEMCVVCLPKLECSICSTDLTNEKFFQCMDCSKVLCKSHYNSATARCLECAEKLSSTPSVGILTGQNSTQNTSEVYTLQANTIQPIISKYNRGEVLESEEISFLMQHQINLPSIEEKYVNIGNIENKMVLIREKDDKPYVVIVPDSPIHLDAKYYGDLFRKLIEFLPEVPETIDGMTSIVNLLFYAANNPRWVQIYETLRQTLLKIAIEVLQVLVLVFRKANIEAIYQTISNSALQDIFAGINVKEALKFIQTNDSEDEIGLFSSDERLDQLLKVLYNLYKGKVLRAAEILALFEILP
ncbi:MAG: hypothetical protein EU530_10790 [Promethearchaeota archaeon]|nr:MAG: hypothetical protein EU530_10790 [Candidatus Lokiarchaeota archaeon]